MGAALRQIRTALAFLTRLPGGAHPEDQAGLTASVPWFGIVGLVIGAIGATVFVVGEPLVGPLPAAALAFTATALVTGGFHEDGLADSFDALAGGWTVERRLEILKDSRHGTFGVLSLVLISLLKVSALASLSGVVAAVVLVVAHSSARAAAVAVMGFAPVARPDGLGADYTRTLSTRRALLGSAVGLATLVAGFGAWAPVVLVGLGVGSVAVVRWAVRKIGGVTGDLLGAVEQVGEVVVLLAAVALVDHVADPWWWK